MTRQNDTGDDRFDPACLPRAVRLDWEHFAAYGWSDRRIADRLGLKLNSLQQRGRRMDEESAAS